MVQKLSGKPWDPPVEPEVVLLVNTIINNVWTQLGWQALATLDISRIGQSNTCLMLLEKDEFWKPSDVCCVFFHVSSGFIRFFLKTIHPQSDLSKFHRKDMRICLLNHCVAKYAESFTEHLASLSRNIHDFSPTYFIWKENL